MGSFYTNQDEMSTMKKVEYYYNNLGNWTAEEWVKKNFLNNPLEIERFNTILNYIPDSTSSVLDIGCGTGIFLHFLEKQYNIQGIGVEIAESKIKYAIEKMNVNAIRGDASHLLFEDKQFDVVTALETIEHLPYGTYENALKEMERVAKHHIIVSVPYRERRIRIKCPYCECQFNPYYHLRRFEETSLRTLFEHFKVIKFHKIGLQLRNPFSKEVQKYNCQSFPEFAICPACGFYNQSKSHHPVTKPLLNQKLGKKILRLPLVPKQYRWVMALYKRV